MLFLFPRASGDGDFSMLGYGDAILPGLLKSSTTCSLTTESLIFPKRNTTTFLVVVCIRCRDGVDIFRALLRGRRTRGATHADLFGAHRLRNDVFLGLEAS